MSNRLIINADQGKHKISRHIYGHFAEHLGRCIYEGFWVGEDSDIPNTRGIRNDVVEALRKLKIPNLRWPGGCFADEYHWMDGIGPRENRASIVNTHWGEVVETNHFGTHEFFDLCEMLGAEPYICGNVGSGSVREMSQWVEYCTHLGGTLMSELRKQNGREEPWALKYFGVGNESWGCGGNMRPEYYADEYRRYGTYVRNYGENKIYKIACGANAQDYEWTEALMRCAGGFMDGLSLHYYTIPGDSWDRKGSSTDFSNDDWFITLRKSLKLEELLELHGAIMDRYDPQKRVGLIVDEWGTWFDVEPGTNPGFLYQQNTMRDALVAGLSLNIFNKYSDRVRMANIAQTVNVLQAMILTNGAEMLLTPTYHIFEMYQSHQDATLLPLHLSSEEYSVGDTSIPAINASASQDDARGIHVTLCHTDPTQSTTIEIELQGVNVTGAVGRVLSASQHNAHNTFENAEAVKPRILSAYEVQQQGSHISLLMPPASVAALRITSHPGA